jgi:hypothetical protein
VAVHERRRAADTPDVGKILSDLPYFSRRVRDEVARSRRAGTRFSIVVFTSQPGMGELPEEACVRALPALLETVRETDTVCRLNTDSIAVLLIDASGEGSRQAAVRLLGRLGADAGRWRVSVFEYPERESVLVDLGLDAA